MLQQKQWMASRNKMEEVLHQTVYSQTEKSGTILFDFYVWTSYMTPGQLTGIHNRHPLLLKFKALPVQLFQKKPKQKKSKVMLQIG